MLIPRKIILFVYIVVILLLASLPLNDKDSSLLNNITNTYVVKIRLDYLVHLVFFLPFILLVKIAYQIPFLQALLTGILFAVLCEGLQYLLPYRSFNINDLIANMIGIGIGVILVVDPVWGWLEREAYRVKK